MPRLVQLCRVEGLPSRRCMNDAHIPRQVTSAASYAFWNDVLGARVNASRLRALVIDTLTVWHQAFTSRINNTEEHVSLRRFRKSAGLCPRVTFMYASCRKSGWTACLALLQPWAFPSASTKQRLLITWPRRSLAGLQQELRGAAMTWTVATHGRRCAVERVDSILQ